MTEDEFQPLHQSDADKDAEKSVISVSVRGLYKTYENFPALNGVSFDVAEGEFIGLLGPSGSGKTTLLRSIAGLEFPEKGQIFMGGVDSSTLSLRDRRIGFVFQHFALFRHMSVADNVAFGLRARPRKERPSSVEIKERVAKLLSLVQLQQFGHRFPSQLSGGQRQRVALARALAIEPRVLLLDEPFGALDARVRKDLRLWLRKLQQELAITTLMVTHDQEEALELCDRVAVINHGLVEQIGKPQELRANPASAFVRAFLSS